MTINNRDVQALIRTRWVRDDLLALIAEVRALCEDPAEIVVDAAAPVVTKRLDRAAVAGVARRVLPILTALEAHL